MAQENDPILPLKGVLFMKPIDTDVLIIGAGMTGTTIARELSRYKVETVVVERGTDVGIQ